VPPHVYALCVPLVWCIKVVAFTVMIKSLVKLTSRAWYGVTHDRYAGLVDAEERFNKYVRRTPKCWEWTGTGDSLYGNFRFQGRTYYAHRYAYASWVGQIEDGMVIHHKCGNTRCVRPTHLQAISRANNTAEMWERQSYLRAIKKLTKEVEMLRKSMEEKK